jgi:hypothetical protein
MCEIKFTDNSAIVKIIIISLFCSGILVEFVSIKYLLISYIPKELYLFLVIHIIGSILISLSMPYISKPIYDNSHLKYLFFSLALLVFIPVIGIFVLVIVFWSKKNGAFNQRTKTVGSTLRQRKISNLPLKLINTNTGCNVSTTSIASILTSPGIKPEERQKAVLNTIKLPDKVAVPLLKKALKDDEDDIRLLAYALLKRKENTIISRLQNRLRKVNETNGVGAFSLHKAIAYDYWEIIYLELMEEDVQKHIVDLSIKHIMNSLRYNENDPGLNLIFAKILLKNGDLVRSREKFIKADVAGIDRKIILPHFTELAFLEKENRNMSKFLMDINRVVSSYKVPRQ